MPDARAAARIINKLDMLLPAIHLDTEPLLEEAERIEEQIKAMLAHQLSAAEERGEADSSPSAMLYG
jgi:predicted ATP-grasp superfamily ATP-dependent carboligase